MATTPANSADTYVRPQVTVRAESNSNIDLSTDNTTDSDVYGYVADVQALIGVATPRSETSIRPRIRFQDYPDRKDFERFEAFFDLVSAYRSERSQLDTIVRYSLEDTYNAELTGGEFDPVDPSNPSNPHSGVVVIGETRSRFEALPEYSVELTERMRLGIAAEYVLTRYDSDEEETTFDDYLFYEGRTFLAFDLDPRRELRVGAFANKFETDETITKTDAYGAEIAYLHKWSENTQFDVRAFYERDETTEFQPFVTVDEKSNVGGSLNATHKGEVSRWRFSLSRSYIATGTASKAESDQIRVQYNREFSPRLEFTGAARYELRNALDEEDVNENRDYLRGDASLRWMIARTWFVEGGYTYIWVDRETAPTSAENNRFFIGFGYRGLNR